MVLTLPILALFSGPLQLGARPAMEAQVPRAEWLLAESGCTACHSAPEVTLARLEPRQAPSLEGLGSRVTTGWLQRFLSTPTAHAPAPDTTSRLDAKEREALVHFLRSDALEGPESAGATDETTLTAAHLESGRRLFHSIGCIACHAPFEEAWERNFPYWLTAEEAAIPAPPVDAESGQEDQRYVAPGTFAPVDLPMPELAARHTIGSLTLALSDPPRFYPDGRMPDFGLTATEARDLSAYLLRSQALGDSRVFQGASGLFYERFDDVSGSTLPDFDALEATQVGVVENLDELPEHPDDNFGFRFTGVIEIPEGGDWTFSLTSDDGSRLAIDGDVLVDNDGLHGSTRVTGHAALEAGPHALRLEYWEQSGDESLELSWSGPSIAPETLPADTLRHARLRYRGTDRSPVDPALAARGAELFARLSCTRCHGEEHPASSPAPEPESAIVSLASLARTDAGCLTDDPLPGLPRYAFSQADRRGLSELLARPTKLTRPLGADDRLERSLARSRCYACHRRDELGGPPPERADHFRASGDFDLGQEGRIPPHLSWVGSKLVPEALAAVLLEGERVRPYLATRMPRFGRDRVDGLAALLGEVDGSLEWDAREANAELQQAGRQLVGTENGLGCIQCHRFLDVPSLGIQAVDLMQVQGRLQPGWFAQLLLDPTTVGMNSRMPSFWEQGASPVDILDRDPVRQTAAIMAYLDLGRSAPLPPGLSAPDSEYELEPDGSTRTVSVFMRDVSPRTQLVGSPEGVHIAFDMQHSRLARIWTGRFFNAKGTWEGRAGALEHPSGAGLVELPSGAPLAHLPDHGSPWPASSAKRLGQSYDASGRPTFRYRIGAIAVRERTWPVIDGATGTARLRRRLELHAPALPDGVWMRLQDDAESASWAVRAAEPSGEPGAQILERRIDGLLERLVAPAWTTEPDGFTATLELEYAW